MTPPRSLDLAAGRARKSSAASCTVTTPSAESVLWDKFPSNRFSPGDNRASSSLQSTMQSICSLWHRFKAFCKRYSPTSLYLPKMLWLIFFPGTAKLQSPLRHYSGSCILMVSCFSSLSRVWQMWLLMWRVKQMFCFVVVYFSQQMMLLFPQNNTIRKQNSLRALTCSFSSVSFSI